MRFVFLTFACRCFFFFCHKIVSISLLCTLLNSVVCHARAEKCIVTVYPLTVLLFSRPSAIFTYLTTLVPMISKYHSCKPEYHTLANTQRYFSGLLAVLPHSKTSKKNNSVAAVTSGMVLLVRKPLRLQYLAGLTV